jgi:hypothetical protein
MPGQVREMGGFSSIINPIQNPMNAFNDFNSLEEDDTPFLSKSKSFNTNFMT